MSKLLQSVTRSIIQQQRIPWAKRNVIGSKHNEVNSQLTKQLLTSSVASSAALLSASKPAQSISWRSELVCNVKFRRQYHFITKSKKLHNLSGYNNNTVLFSNYNFRGIRFRSQIFHKYQPVMDAPEGVFRGSVDRFNGITVESSVEYEPNINFVEKLNKSLHFWQQNKRRGIWFKVQTEHADWIPHLTQQQFDFHHAKNGFVVMYRWLPLEEYANIPEFAHTMVGVGGLVVNNKNEVLVVSERYALIPNSWKLPGGYVEPSENIVDAAIREVREETGIDCEFKTVVCIRHSHRGGFGCSDIYVVVGLTPLTEDLKRCEREIAKIAWMPISEYLQHPHVHETNRHFVRTFLDYEQRGIRFTCEKAKHQVLQTEYNLYYMQPQESKDKTKCLPHA